MTTIRLQKLLAQGGMASRRKAEGLISAGEVTVNGAVVTAMGLSVDPSKDRVEVNGKRIQIEEPEYRILLKPRGCLCTLEKTPGGSARPSLCKFVPDAAVGFAVVAPLDFLSEGVVLLTTDGALAERMSRGGGHVPMTYHLKFQGALTDEILQRLHRGWRWEGQLIKPLQVAALATTGKNTWVEMVIAESRPRALKAAGEVVRHSLLKISRVRLGTISFEGLKMGMSRDLTIQEVKSLKNDAGAPIRTPATKSTSPKNRQKR
jgi:23S rRNA pseudouridine2605 synthase